MAGSNATASATSAQSVELDEANQLPAAIDDLSLSIQPGEFVALIGANGSGKTTIARHINALLKPVKGRVLTVGLDTADPNNLFAIRSRAGMVFQDPNTQIVTSIVADDVAFGPENLNVQHPELQQRVDNALETVHMTAHAGADPTRLSGGERQRVAIAGILAMSPELLIFDEPAAMLDIRGRNSVRQLMHELHAAGMTIILITHSMEEAALASRVVVVDQGQIALDGTPDEVFSNYEILEQLGLDSPFTLRLIEALRQRGIELRATLHTDTLLEQLCTLY